MTEGLRIVHTSEATIGMVRVLEIKFVLTNVSLSGGH